MEEHPHVSKKLLIGAAVIFVVALVVLEAYREGSQESIALRSSEVKPAVSTPSSPRRSTPTLKIGGRDIIVDLVATEEGRALGLSGREALLEGEGMLFVFRESGTYGFWMKDMKFPIDIIWLNENLEVVHIKTDARPESYPEIFAPPSSARYVLEVPAGFAESAGLREADKAELAF